MSENKGGVIVIPDHVLVQRLPNGEAMMLDVESEAYFGLNEVGTRMIDLLASNRSFADSLELLLEEYDVDPEVLERDMRDLVESLETRGLVVLA